MSTKMTTRKAPAPGKAKPPAIPESVENGLPIVHEPGESTASALAGATLRPSINAAIVIEAFNDNLLGNDTSMLHLVAGLSASMKIAEGGDLHIMEGMLIGQATALQTMFTSLARRAAGQKQLRHYEAFLGLALKAQAQSRATISALVDLKYPRQATFIKQANVANGPQQVNNGTAPAGGITHAEETKTKQTKLLEVDHGQPGGWMDTGAQAAPARSHQTVAAVGKVHRPQKPRG